MNEKIMTRVVKRSLFLTLIICKIAYAHQENRSEIEQARKAIENCQIRNMHGKQDSRLCLLKTQFMDSEIFGPLAESENFLILHGSTGNGKTSIAQNISAEVQEKFPDAEYIEIDCSVVKGPYENEGARNLKEKFDKITELTTSGYKVVVLFDELDSIAVEKERDLQQKETAQYFWRFLDRNSNNRNLLVIATTNMYDKLVPQVKSRFLNKVEIKGPDKQARVDLLSYYCKKIEFPLEASEIKKIADKTEKVGRRGLKNIILQLRQKKNLGLKSDLTEIIEKEKQSEDLKDESFKNELINATKRIASRTADILTTALTVSAVNYIGNKMNTNSAQLNNNNRQAHNHNQTKRGPYNDKN